MEAIIVIAFLVGVIIGVAIKAVRDMAWDAKQYNEEHNLP